MKLLGNGYKQINVFEFMDLSLCTIVINGFVINDFVIIDFTLNGDMLLCKYI